MKNVLLALLVPFYWMTVYSQKADIPTRVKIIKAKNGFQLLVNGRTYFIKGAVGSDYLEKLKQYGGNSIRTGSKPEILDKAHSLGLTALVNLPVRAERDGMDYDDTASLRPIIMFIYNLAKPTLHRFGQQIPMGITFNTNGRFYLKEQHSLMAGMERKNQSRFPD